MHETSCEDCPAFKNSIFSSLSSKQLQFLQLNKITKKYRPGETIFARGSIPEHIYCTKFGITKITLPLDKGVKYIIELATPSFAFCLPPVTSKKPNDLDATAQSLVILCEIKNSAFITLLETDHQFNVRTIKHLAAVILKYQHRILSLLNRSAAERVAEALIELLSIDLDLKWSRKDIAQYANTTVESVIRILGAFEQRGLIKKKGRNIVILDQDGLSRECKIFCVTS